MLSSDRLRIKNVIPGPQRCGLIYYIILQYIYIINIIHSISLALEFVRLPQSPRQRPPAISSLALRSSAARECSEGRSESRATPAGRNVGSRFTSGSNCSPSGELQESIQEQEKPLPSSRFWQCTVRDRILADSSQNTVNRFYKFICSQLCSTR